jgi:hypothetical protein
MSKVSKSGYSHCGIFFFFKGRKKHGPSKHHAPHVHEHRSEAMVAVKHCQIPLPFFFLSLLFFHNEKISDLKLSFLQNLILVSIVGSHFPIKIDQTLICITWATCLCDPWYVTQMSDWTIFIQHQVSKTLNPVHTCLLVVWAGANERDLLLRVCVCLVTLECPTPPKF